MKRILTLLFFMLPLLAEAQHNYRIVSVLGDVSLRRSNGSNWTKATPTTLSLMDTLYIKKGGSVSIEEISTHRSFGPFIGMEKSCLRDLLNQEEKKRKSSFVSCNSLVLSRTQQKTGPHIPSDSGDEIKGVGDTNGINADLYDSVFSYLLQCHDSKRKTDEKNNDIKVTKTKVSKNMFSISIQNNTEKTYYCNVVHFDDGYPNLCFFLDGMDFIPITPGDIVDFSSFPLIQDSGHFFVIASEQDLSIVILEATFEGKPIAPSCKLESVKIIDL